MTEPIDPPPDRAPVPIRELRVDTASLLGGPDRFGTLLARWLADATVDEAAAERARRAFSRHRDEQDSTIPGVLLTLAERGDTLVIEAAGTRWRGTLRAMVSDAVVLAADQGGLTVIAFGAVDAVRGEGRPVQGARVVEIPTTMLGALETAASERHPVTVRTATGSVVAGELDAVGRDHLRLRAPDSTGRVWVPIDAVAAVTLS